MSKEIYITPDTWGNDIWLTYDPETEAKKMRDLGNEWADCDGSDCDVGREVCGIAVFSYPILGSYHRYLGERHNYYHVDTDGPARLIGYREYYR